MSTPKILALVSEIERMPAPPAPSPAVVAAIYARAAAEGEGGASVEIGGHLHPIRPRLCSYLAMIAEGASAKAAGEACGLPWAVWSALTWSDMGGLRRLEIAATALRDEAWREDAVSALYGRAVEGVAEPVFGRDGIIGHRRVYSDRLLQLAVERREQAFRRQPPAAPAVHIGQQVVYHLGGLHLGGLLDGASVPHKDEAIEIEAIEIEAEDA